MGTNPVALYEALCQDLSPICRFGPVAPDKLPPGSTYQDACTSSMLYNFLRKFKVVNSTDQDNAALDKFIASNKKCGTWELSLDSWVDDQLYGEFRNQVYNFFHPGGNMLFSSFSDLLENGRVGPGSAIGAEGQGFYAKLFSSRLTTTDSSLYSLYRAYASLYPEWSNAELIRSNHFGTYAQVKGSRLSFVPKDVDISRLICVEPSLNMVFQLGLGTLLERRLEGLFDIDLRTQSFKNQSLARSGSVDGSISTIDLSSASDSISINMLKDCLPSWVFETLLEIRSANINIRGSWHELNMVSTMGNGFTFPLQTVIFACIVRACLVYSRRPHDQNSWGVFGDDICCPTSVVRYVLRLLTILGFSVNPRKTFFEGPFRESCGADWFSGQPCRPVFLKKLDSIQDTYVALNLLNQWSAVTGFSVYNAVSYLLSNVQDLYLVPFESGNETGYRVPLDLVSRIHRDANSSYMYRAYRSVAKRIRIDEGTIRVPKGCKKLIYNPSGLLISFLRGEVVSGEIGVRLNSGLFRTKFHITPNWDYMGVGALVNGTIVPWQHWYNAVLGNTSNPAVRR